VNICSIRLISVLYPFDQRSILYTESKSIKLLLLPFSFFDKFFSSNEQSFSSGQTLQLGFLGLHISLPRRIKFV